MTADTSTARPTRRRRFWAGGPVLLATLAIIITIRATQLWGLPDIGDPFDIEEFARPIPDATNAFVVYKQAFEKLVKEPGNVSTADWGSAGTQQRKWLEENRGTLDLWRRGTSRPDALYIPPKSMNIMTLLPLIQGMLSFGRLATLEGTRLEGEGDLKGALEWHIAVLRSSRHCQRRGVAVQRTVGVWLASQAKDSLLAWAVAPEVDAAMLRRALDAVTEIVAMTPPASETLKCQYLLCVNTIESPAFHHPATLSGGRVPVAWKTGPAQAYLQARRSSKQEPERSRRVFRLVFANWLAYCDRPRSDRPPIASLPPTAGVGPAILELYTPDGSAPETARALAPEEIASWLNSGLFAEILPPSTAGIDKAIEDDRATFANLRITLAKELYKKENGQYPAKVADLVGRYLEALPEGYDPINDDEKTDKSKIQ